MNTAIKLTANFSLSEMIASETASRKGIKNDPFLEDVLELQALCTSVLQPLREHAKRSITISSGYRSTQLNTAVGGVSGSQHMKGQAADIHLPDMATGKEWFQWIMNNTDFDQLIWEHDSHGTYWIHVSHKRLGGNRHHVIQNMLKS